MRINEHVYRLCDASGAIQIGEVLRDVGLGHVGEVLLQISGDLPLCGRIERSAKLAERVSGRHEDQAVEPVAGAGVVQRGRHLVNKVPLLGPMKVRRRRPA